METTKTRIVMVGKNRPLTIKCESKVCTGCKNLKKFVYPWEIRWLSGDAFSFHYCLVFSRKATDPCNGEEFGALPEPMEYDKNNQPLRVSRCLSGELQYAEETK